MDSEPEPLIDYRPSQWTLDQYEEYGPDPADQGGHEYDWDPEGNAVTQALYEAADQVGNVPAPPCTGDCNGCSLGPDPRCDNSWWRICTRTAPHCSQCSLRDMCTQALEPEREQQILVELEGDSEGLSFLEKCSNRDCTTCVHTHYCTGALR
jgi:hypothetical protein